jgi:hypothetical protein
MFIFHDQNEGQIILLREVIDPLNMWEISHISKGRQQIKITLKNKLRADEIRGISAATYFRNFCIPKIKLYAT